MPLVCSHNSAQKTKGHCLGLKRQMLKSMFGLSLQWLLSF